MYPGDFAYFSGGPSNGGICHGITVSDNINFDKDARSRDIRFENISIYSAPGMGIVTDQHGGGIVQVLLAAHS